MKMKTQESIMVNIFPWLFEVARFNVKVGYGQILN